MLAPPRLARGRVTIWELQCRSGMHFVFIPSYSLVAEREPLPSRGVTDELLAATRASSPTRGHPFDAATRRCVISKPAGALGASKNGRPADAWPA
jgi:hypothetical protein